MRKKFEEIDHSGDVGIDAWGENEERAFENVTLGLFSLMAFPGVSAVREREISVSSENMESLLVDWLSEVITASGVHGEVYCEADVRFIGRNEIRGVIRGEPIDPGRHELRFEVKAATYHGLLFESHSGGFRARVIFDL